MPHTYDELVARSKEIYPLRTCDGHTGQVASIVFSLDGRWMASGSFDHMVRLWEVATGNAVRRFDGHTNWSWSVAFSPNGRWLASGSLDNKVRLWEVATEQGGSIIQEHSFWAMSVAFSPNGRWLASGSYDKTIRLWDTETRSTVRTYEGHTDWVRRVAFSPDGRWLASGSDDKSVRLWEVATGQLIRTLGGHTGYVSSVAFSPDGRLLASASYDHTVRLWEATGGREVRSLDHQTNSSVETLVSTAIWSPDGTLLVSFCNNGIVRFWHVASGQLVSTLQVARGGTDRYWGSSALAISPDGRLLATCTTDNPSSIQLWDISVLDVGAQPSILQKEQPAVTTFELQTPVRTQLRTLPFCHVWPQDEVPPARAANWLQSAAAAGWPLPLALAHDLGLLLTLPAAQRSLHKPDYLPFDEDTSAYLATLKRMAEHPLILDLPGWQPPFTDAVLSVLIARLVEGLELPSAYRSPSGAEGVRFVRALVTMLGETKPAELWQQTPANERPNWRVLLSAENLARLEKNLLALKRDELRFLALYGAPLAGTPDPRDLLDLLALTGLPPVARLALSQALHLLPQVSELHNAGGLQTYPEGGYEGLERKGSLDSLLPTETAYPYNVFLHRVLNHEALYYGRERPPEQRRELVYLVGQAGWGLGGDGQVLVRALLLALGQLMQQRGYEVLYSFAGATLSEPHSLDKPGEVGRVLYYQERAAVDGAQILHGVLEHLNSWREMYRRRLVFWVISDTFDADETTAHKSLYQALKAECEQQVWYVHVGSAQAGRARRTSLPATARYFERWQIVESALLWTAQQAESA